MSASAADRQIRALRAPKPAVDPFAAHGSLLEDERRPDDSIERTLTVFLAGAECPFTCSFCDLWRYTISGPTPEGALPAQLSAVLDALDEKTPRPDRLKLYNASNFFDRRAVPAADLPRLAEFAAPFAGVTVESHASTIGARTLEFARRLEGRLEVAVGLETIHHRGMAHLNKRLDLGTFERASHFLAEHGMDLRVFVLLGTPYVAADDQVEWTVRAVKHAARCGAALVSIIPLRGGNGELERLAALGEFNAPTLTQLEATLDRCAGIAGTAVTADLWDVERLDACEHCRGARIERLRRINLTGVAEPQVACIDCAS